MKTGKTLQELAAEIQRRSEDAKDYVLPSNQLHVYERPVDFKEGTTTMLRVPTIIVPGGDRQSDTHLGITSHAHGQLAEKVKIHKTYYDRMLSDDAGGALWAQNVNHWLQRDAKPRMVRTLDGNMRALMSNSYQRIDNVHVANVALGHLLDTKDSGAMQLISHDVTDRRLYIKALFPRVEGEVRKGDVVQAGVEIGNSEIGDGSLYVLPLIYRLWCLNGMTMQDAIWKRAHLGSRIELPEGITLAEDTMRADDHALLLKLRDVIHAAAGEVFARNVDKLREAADESTRIASPIAAVQVLSKTVGLRESERESVLERLIRGNDYTKYGVANAVTNLANDAQDYDRASELEKIGAKVIDLKRSEWKEIMGAELKLAA